MLVSTHLVLFALDYLLTRQTAANSEMLEPMLGPVCLEGLGGKVMTAS